MRLRDLRLPAWRQSAWRPSRQTRAREAGAARRVRDPVDRERLRARAGQHAHERRREPIRKCGDAETRARGGEQCGEARGEQREALDPASAQPAHRGGAIERRSEPEQRVSRQLTDPARSAVRRQILARRVERVRQVTEHAVDQGRLVAVPRADRDVGLAAHQIEGLASITSSKATPGCSARNAAIVSTVKSAKPSPAVARMVPSSSRFADGKSRTRARTARSSSPAVFARRAPDSVSRTPSLRRSSSGSRSADSSRASRRDSVEVASPSSRPAERKLPARRPRAAGGDRPAQLGVWLCTHANQSCRDAPSRQPRVVVSVRSPPGGSHARTGRLPQARRGRLQPPRR